MPARTCVKMEVLRHRRDVVPVTAWDSLTHWLISAQVGVNDPFIPVDYMRYMLKYDTVHGRFPNTVEVAGDSIAVGGEKVKVFGERDPSRAVWKSTSELGSIEQTQLRSGSPEI